MNIPALPERAYNAHKNNVGRVLVIAGSMGMTGAGALASKAALRSGAGMVTWAIPQNIAHIAEIKCTESITWAIPATEGGQASIEAREHLSEASHEADAVILGPGMAASGETGELIRLLIPEIHAPLILDAGALMALGKSYTPIQKRRMATILTPHPGEMARLTDQKIEAIESDRKGSASKLAQQSTAVVVLKGNDTVIAGDGGVTINKTGNNGMATAGSGDVLAGLLAGLLAQKMSATEAAVLATYLHGLAGDIGAKKLGIHSLNAGDILDCLPAAFLQFAAEK